MDPWKRKEVIGDATLYLGDCLEILPTLPKVDAVITDPPYGINAARDRNSQKDGWVDYPCGGWDKERPSKAHFDAILQASGAAIVWGGNYFTDFLPPTMQWLVWDKGQRISQSDCELAYTTLDKALRSMTLNRAAIAQDGAVHPTQKPVQVMAWCLDFSAAAQTVLDPFMGSGTTGVACAQLGKAFTGIERERKYFDIACERIARAQAQGQMFAPESAALPTQQAMEL